MEKTPSFPSREFDALLREYRCHKLRSIEPDTIPEVPNQGENTSTYVYKVVDGDTIKVLYTYGSKEHKISIRVNGVDTPETRRSRDLEEKAGRVVGKIVADKLHKRFITVKFLKWDKYGGRMVGDVYMPGGNVTLCDYLISNKLGHPYSGKTKKDSWTDEELNYIIDFGDGM